MPGEKPRLSAVLTNSFHMRGALGSSDIENVVTENRTCNVRRERRALCSPIIYTLPPLAFKNSQNAIHEPATI